ncbi:MAG: ribose 5-phosphate isomerase B [Aggregatilineales bacterium]|nr:ribose 5-phosphate isomerase B [Chloroflexota bacterium]HPV07195.1 ribose 5-phosphate isomerase B [Aggregatilineales bacterium]HQE18511.1 ribose 5-phosphate isomerase B [Aggregatilineales bacterium]
MEVVVGADHAGYELKEVIKAYLKEKGYDVIDVGTDSLEAVDYPDFARAVGEEVLRGEGRRGVLICGSGVGASIAANKIPGIRAAICHDTYSARQGVEHDDMNVLTLGGRIIGVEVAKELVNAFLSAEFSRNEERHVRRVGKIKAIEREFLSGK